MTERESTKEPEALETLSGAEAASGSDTAKADAAAAWKQLKTAVERARCCGLRWDPSHGELIIRQQDGVMRLLAGGFPNRTACYQWLRGYYQALEDTGLVAKDAPGSKPGEESQG